VHAVRVCARARACVCVCVCVRACVCVCGGGGGGGGGGGDHAALPRADTHTPRNLPPPLLHRCQGYAIGNGVTDDVTDGNAYVEFAASKSLIPQTLYRAIMAACNGSTWAPPPGSRCARQGGRVCVGAMCAVCCVLCAV
jgi:hypothetical protein